MKSILYLNKPCYCWYQPSKQPKHRLGCPHLVFNDIIGGLYKFFIIWGWKELKVKTWFGWTIWRFLTNSTGLTTKAFKDPANAPDKYITPEEGGVVLLVPEADWLVKYDLK